MWSIWLIASWQANKARHLWPAPGVAYGVIDWWKISVGKVGTSIIDNNDNDQHGIRSGCGYAVIAHAYRALQHALQILFIMADKEDLHESAADLSFYEWVMRKCVLHFSAGWIRRGSLSSSWRKKPLNFLSEWTVDNKVSWGVWSVYRLSKVSTACLEKISTCNNMVAKFLKVENGTFDHTHFWPHLLINELT